MELRPLEVAHLGVLGEWFDDSETRHWLGGRDWPAKCLTLVGPGRHALIGFLDGQPVGLIDAEISPGGRIAFAIVIAPARRKQGIGVQLVDAAIDSPMFADATEWFAGVERGNLPSQRLLERCGFVRVSDEDADGFSYFARWREGVPEQTWRLPD